ncbi:MAG: L-lysine 2,3-aminomutase [Verrucomicrobiota bacterium]|jgi:lysine 2,3-aminomutase
MNTSKRTLRSLDDFAAAGLLPADADAAALGEVARQFSLALSPELAGRIGGSPCSDPVALQFVPDARELEIDPRELADPIGDELHSPQKGIVHRYPDRVLLKPTHSCAVYCRFCFRREKVGPGEETLRDPELDAALAYIEARPAIWEVILTGGDPLVLPPSRLAAMLRRLAAITHVEVIRLHSRVPVVAPERITPELLQALRCDKAVWCVVHVNAAAELGPAAARSLAALVDAGIPLLSQSVLLKGVNDSAAALESLFRRLCGLRVKPYYLHHPDLVRGTGHFRVSLAQGQEILRQLRGELSGIAQPTYILDIPGGAGKVPCGPSFLRPLADGSWEVEDPGGRKHSYPG